jgi:DNA-binding NarL/FixJ family response regulator
VLAEFVLLVGHLDSLLVSEVSCHQGRPARLGPYGRRLDRLATRQSGPAGEVHALLRRVLVVSGIRIYRDALANVLRTACLLAAVATAAGVEDALASIRSAPPDVVLVDLPPWEASRLLNHIDSAVRARVVALGVPETEQAVLGWAALSVGGCLTRDTPFEDLPGLLERAARGEIVCSPSAAGLLFRYARMAAVTPPPGLVPHLTRREAQVLRLVAEGWSNRDIARALSIQLSTVKNHVHRVFAKLGIRNRAEAAGWLPHPSPVSSPGPGERASHRASPLEQSGTST